MQPESTIEYKITTGALVSIFWLLTLYALAGCGCAILIVVNHSTYPLSATIFSGLFSIFLLCLAFAQTRAPFRVYINEATGAIHTTGLRGKRSLTLSEGVLVKRSVIFAGRSGSRTYALRLKGKAFGNVYLSPDILRPAAAPQIDRLLGRYKLAITAPYYSTPTE